MRPAASPPPAPVTAPGATRLLDGFAVVLSRGVTRTDAGRTLFGGSPARLLYLLPVAQALLAGDRLIVTGATSGRLARLLLDRGLADPCPSAVLPGAPVEADVTVVVPVRDRAGQLDRLLGALVGVRVVVVDDGSVDAGATAAVAARHGARLQRRDVPGGPAAARNAGLAVVRTDLVAFLDSDVVPHPGWLALLLRHLSDPAVGIVAPRVLGLDAVAGVAPGPVRAWVGAYEAARSSLDLGPDPALVTPRGRVSYVPSAALLARVAALGGGFDETMRVAEDVDLVWRVAACGWRVRYEPASRVGHEHRVAPGPWLARKAFYGSGAAALAVRHGRAVAPVVLAPWTAAVAASLLAQRWWSLPVAVVVTCEAVWRISRRLTGSEHPLRTAATLAPYGLVSALQQAASALTRQWWPLAAVACLVSRRARRAVAVAAVAEGLLDHHRVRPALGPAQYVVAHRLDDLAYGAGLWWGAARARTAAPLLPDLTGRPYPVGGPGSTDRPAR